MREGIIIKGIGGFYYVKAENGKIYECKALGIFRKKRITPMIGDRVSIETEGEKGSIVKIEERRTMLVRPPVANIDALILVAAAATPEPSLFLLDKMLVSAEKQGVRPILCINKTDLTPREDLVEIYEKAGYEVLCVSAERQENIDALEERLKGRVTAFAGLSGVGKSSLLNLIAGCAMETGVVSGKIGRGRHTTRHVELMELANGGFVFDTPGFSSLEITDIKAAELQRYFPEIGRHENECRFRGCAHVAEPDCVVRQLVEDGEIPRSRHESYTALYQELKKIKDWQ